MAGELSKTILQEISALKIMNLDRHDEAGKHTDGDEKLAVAMII